MSLQLSTLNPFAQGGNRLCFIHPDVPEKCIKVRRPDFTLEDCRRKKGFPKNLRPLSSFDDNLEEFKVVSHLYKIKGEGVYKHIYRCFGFVDTDLGAGLETELVRDDDGKISLSLKQYIWECGYSPECEKSINELINFWKDNLIPSRDLLTHNVLVQQADNGVIKRLVVIDGLGSPSVVPFFLFPRFLKIRVIERKTNRFLQRINDFVKSCNENKRPSKVGVLNFR
ncbi:MAG: hypothetical protein JXR12_03260 [Neptunomonas phycophila]|uniref:YrbL family protein n=1 Tax=Neptunomonas phycophila TaxID=1572645 RepID=UPI003B8B6B7E